MTVRRRTEPLNGCLAHAQQSSSQISRNSFEIFTVFCLTQSNKHRFNSGVKKQIPISQSDKEFGGTELLRRLRRLIVDLANHDDIFRFMDVDDPASLRDPVLSLSLGTELDDFGGGFSLLL